MKQILLLWPNRESLKKSLKKSFTELFTEYEISEDSNNFSTKKAAILLVNAEDGPMEVAVNQLIKMRKNKVQNVFGFIYNSNAVSDPEILKLIKQRTMDLLKEYGYLGLGFVVHSDSKGLNHFISFVQEKINDSNQMNFVSPVFVCRFCGFRDNKKFAICSSCRKKQKKSFFACLFGKK